jgi:hypothetical protein
LYFVPLLLFFFSTPLLSLLSFPLFSLHAPLESDAVSRPFLNLLKKKKKNKSQIPTIQKTPNPAARISILPFPDPPPVLQ